MKILYSDNYFFNQSNKEKLKLLSYFLLFKCSQKLLLFIYRNDGIRKQVKAMQMFSEISVAIKNYFFYLNTDKGKHDHLFL